jgi:hypothetical protein
MKFTNRLKIFFCLLLVSFFLSSAVLAATKGPQKIIEGLNDTARQAGVSTDIADENSLATFLGKVVNYLFGSISMVFLTIILIGGYMWLVAGGNEENVKKAKQWIINGLSGMIVIFIAYALVFTIGLSLKLASGQTQ